MKPSVFDKLYEAYEEKCVEAGRLEEPTKRSEAFDECDRQFNKLQAHPDWPVSQPSQLETIKGQIIASYTESVLDADGFLNDLFEFVDWIDSYILLDLDQKDYVPLDLGQIDRVIQELVDFSNGDSPRALRCRSWLAKVRRIKKLATNLELKGMDPAGRQPVVDGGSGGCVATPAQKSGEIDTKTRKEIGIKAKELTDKKIKPDEKISILNKRFNVKLDRKLLRSIERTHTNRTNRQSRK